MPLGLTEQPNTFLAGPASGSAAQSSYRLITTTDLPASTVTHQYIRAQLAVATASNPVTSQPLTAPPAWAANTAYHQGVAVTNGSNVYGLITPGTSAASGGPSGVGTAAIADNTATWYYVGPTWSSSPLAPTMSSTATRYNAGVYYSTTLAGGNLGAVQIKDTTRFALSQISDGSGINNSATWAGAGLLGQVSFWCDEPAFQIVFNNNAASALYVSVNGVPAAWGVAIDGTAGNSYYQFVFADRRPRLITAEVPAGTITTFYGVLCQTKLGKVWAPTFSNSYRLSMVGTSYFQGNPPNAVSPVVSLGPQIARLLGNYNAGQYWIDSQGGGTGYVTAGAQSVFGSATRLANLFASTPDVVLISGGGINDAVTLAGLSSANQVITEQAACLSYYQAVRAGLPNALMIVVGSESGSTGPSAAVFNMELAVKQAVAAFGDSNCFYIPQSAATNGQAWISGTGNTGTTNGSGNSDVYIYTDNIHPVQAGELYLAQQHVNAIAGLMNSIR